MNQGRVSVHLEALRNNPLLYFLEFDVIQPHRATVIHRREPSEPSTVTQRQYLCRQVAHCPSVLFAVG